ncbi:MAG: tRNA (N(6)-L-threonylcarbamoyladenosine(37)-C(2))-methylthiotransferase MtaB [Gammaproteobacteria bacterium]|nr:tRNA (N(6)-L-threonylcarbamoyladenosine(37)-C(2))-methylthiotransferase MtaB [Gammaproteobacteria bacterium]
MTTHAKAVTRVAYTTFGCRLNQYDTEAIRTLLDDSGRYETVSNDAPADVYVVNTCSVTSRADASARKAIRRLHDKHPDARIVVTGCYAQRAPEEIEALPGVSLIVGAADRARVVQEIDAARTGVRVSVSPIKEARTFLEVPITEMMDRSRAFVKIQEGCNESCSFCIVPQTRGASRSREPQKVIEQAKSLIDRGYVELILTGVHLGDYGLDLSGERQLASLIERLLVLPGLERFRLSSIEPASVTPRIIELMATEAKFARHFHIPFQSGSNRVLERMRRRYTAEYFYDLVERIASAMPDCGIGADVICGFPGETDDDFQATFDALTTLPITYLHPFTYSVRPGSEAEAFGDQVAGDIKKRRTRSLKRLSRDKSQRARESMVGRTEKILIEQGPIDGRYFGWTENYLKVAVRGLNTMPDRLIDVSLTAAEGDVLLGEAR